MAQPASERNYELPHTAPNHNEGKTFAGWLLFWVVCLGGLVCAIGFISWEMWIIAVGAVIAVLGVVIGKVLSVMGYGQPNGGTQVSRAGEPDWYA